MLNGHSGVACSEPGGELSREDADSDASSCSNAWLLKTDMGVAPIAVAMATGGGSAAGGEAQRSCDGDAVAEATRRAICARSSSISLRMAASWSRISAVALLNALTTGFMFNQNYVEATREVIGRWQWLCVHGLARASGERLSAACHNKLLLPSAPRFLLHEITCRRDNGTYLVASTSLVMLALAVSMARSCEATAVEASGPPAAWSA